MKVRHQRKEAEKTELQMTPMIDIVFQLLVFFIMLFQIIKPEGDFHVKLPVKGAPAGPRNPDVPLPMTVVLTADENGKLQNISLTSEQGFSAGSGRRVGNTAFSTDFKKMQEQLIALKGIYDAHDRDIWPEHAKVTLECSKNLHYRYVMEAMDNVSHYSVKGADGKPVIKKLVEKIRFKARDK